MAPVDPRGPAAKHARKWMKAMRAEAAAKHNYMEETEPRRRERMRKTWLKALNDLAILKMPSDEALRVARKDER